MESVNLQVEPNVVTASETDETAQQVRISSTIPVVCKNKKGKCELTVRVVTPDRILTTDTQTRPRVRKLFYSIMIQISHYH